MYVWAAESVRCMPAGLCRLHHYISAWPAVRSAWGLLFYITALPFSSLVGSPLALSPHHLLSTLQLSVLSTFPSLLCGFLCQHRPFRTISYWLTNVVRWSWLARTSQPFKKHYSSTVTHACMKLSTPCQTSNALEKKIPLVSWLLLYIHTLMHVNKCLCLDMEDPSVGFSGI